MASVFPFGQAGCGDQVPQAIADLMIVGANRLQHGSFEFRKH